MDRDPCEGTGRKQFLRVDPAHCFLQRYIIEPVTLERRWIRMSDPSTKPSTTKVSSQTSTTSSTSRNVITSAASSSSSASSSSASATSSQQLKTSSTVGVSSTISSPKEASPVCSTAVTPRATMTMPSSSSASPTSTSSTLPTQTSTSTAAGAVPAPSSPPVRLVELAQAQKQPLASPPLAATTMTPTAAVSPAGPGASTGAASALPSRTLVGGQRPLGEESPVIILTTAKSDDVNIGAETSKTISSSTSGGSDKPGSDLSPSRKRATKQLTPPQGRQKPEETSKLSTNLETPHTSERGRELVRRAGKPMIPIVQFSEASPISSPKRDENDVMQFFQEQEKSLQESFLSLPKHQQQQSQRKKRSPSPKFHQAAPGLEHLDNLVRLMEQLSSLKDENSRLRKRCDYLESTKVLLQAKRDLTSLDSSSSSSGFITSQSKLKYHHHHHHRIHHHRRMDHGGEKSRSPSGENVSRFRGISSRPRLSSAEELGYLHIEDSSSDQRPKRPKSGLTKRSFSTGSLEIPSELLDEMSGIEGGRKIKTKHGLSVFGKATGVKGKSKGSKWARVKKVLTGQKLYEELGTTIRSIRDLGRSSSHVRYSTGSTSHEMGATTIGLSSGGGGGDQRLVPDSGIFAGDLRTGARPPLATASSFPGESSFKADQESIDSSLTSEIWMGPPDWWEEYEASKESCASTNSACSVIEVTTLYLGAKKEPGESDPPSPTSNQALASLGPSEKMAQEQFLSIEKSLPRRQSSPSLSTKETGEEDDFLDELACSSETHSRPLHKSASCKSADLELPKSSEFSSPSVSEGRYIKKSHRTAWGRVKDIIHTRKDSIKKRPKREKSDSRGFDSEETSEADIDGLLEDQWRSTDSFGEGLLSRSTPKTSPIIIRQQGSKQELTSDSPPGPGQQSKASPSKHGFPGSSPGNVDLTALLAGSMSDEFTKKMQEWEQKKSRKASVRVSADESDFGSLDVSSASQEFPIRTIDLRDYKGPVPDGISEETTPQESHTSMEVLGAPNPSINVEEIQRRMTGSFSRKMQEWEKLKYRSQSVTTREVSPDMERKGSKGRKDDRQKSKRSRTEKEKEKMERQRERDMQKVEREQMKLEKEKLRIEKERLRALEKEAKLEKLKGRLSQPDTEASFKNPVLSPLAEYKVTADFARKLHEWELKKGLSHDVSNSIYLEAQKLSMQHLREEQMSKSQDEDEGDGKSPVAPLSLQAFWDSPEESSPVEKYSQMSLDDVDGDGDEEAEGDDDTGTSLTDECLTKSNIVSLERANQELLQNLQRKELEYATVQREVQNVNEKLAKVREEHAKEMARFHRELALGSVTEPVKLEVGELETTMGQMEDKIKAMENFGERLALSMESAAVGKWSSVEGEGAVHTQLVELVDQMRGMLVQASQSEERSQKTSALTNFETLYSQAMKLQVQMNNLRLSHLERNREIMVVKRQLLLQEVNNLLLQADITRRETELYQYHAAKRFASLRRWNTFSGTDRGRPQAQVEISQAKAVPKEDSSQAIEAPRVNIPYIPEEVILASAASSSLSAPASPSAIEAAGGNQVHPMPAASSQSHSSPGAARDVSTDQAETHFLSPSSASRCDQPSILRRKSDETASVAVEGGQPSTSLRLPEPIVHLPPRTPKSDHSPTTPTSPASISLTGTASSTEDMKGSSATLVGVTTGPPMDESFSSHASSTGKPEITTICDSAPLHKELRALRKEKSRVERGTPTLIMRGGKGFTSAPSPEESPGKKRTTGTPDQTIPVQQRQREARPSQPLAPSATIDTDNSLAPTVMECTDPIHTVDPTPQTTESAGASGGVGAALHQSRSLADTAYRRDLPPTCDLPRTGPRSPRSPVSKHNYLRRQKEERDTKLKDYRAISPKGSPISARGKPPLPRQNTPVRQSPSASPATDKSPRSKSVGDMERPAAPDSPSAKPLQDAINKFEKRATVCETEDRPIELRKTPSPTLHLPRVGLVSRVRRLKPAAELLEESQRYRSGQSIYATRIMQRYLPKDEVKGECVGKPVHNKENTGSVHAMVRRFSRETTPELSLKRTDSPRSPSEHITSKFSSPSGPEAQNGASPFKDLTNDRKVKKMADTLNGQNGDSSPDRTLSESDIDKQLPGPSSSRKNQNRKSCEVAMVLSSSSAMSTESSYKMVYATESEKSALEQSAAITGPTNHQSLPILLPQGTPEGISRGRAATYSASEPGKRSRGSTDKDAESPSSSKSREPETKDVSSKRLREKKEKEPGFKFPSSLSPVRRGVGRGKGGTVGILCKQSISFDLGVSLHAHQSSPESSSKSRQVRSWDPSESIKAEEAAAAASASSAEYDVEMRPSSSSGATAMGGESGRPLSGSSTEGEVASSSPASGEKKKSRRFLDSSWLQKSKKFFKVSK